MRGWRSWRDHRAGKMTCRELVRLVTDYLEGELPERDRRRFEAHLRECDGCAAYLEQMRETITLVGAIDERDLDPHLRDALITTFHGWSANGKFPRRWRARIREARHPRRPA